MAVLTGKRAPELKAEAVWGNEIKPVNLADYNGKYVLLFFYPLDFTFVCPTELHAFQDKLKDFKARNVEVLACSVDSKFSHLNWLNTPKNKGGIQGIEYGLIADPGGNIAREWDVIAPAGIAYRGLFLIDREGVVRHQVVNDLPLGRNVDEALRVIDALQHVEKHGEVCPANWNKGDEAIKPTKESVSAYLAKK